jgi:hypothetical protein
MWYMVLHERTPIGVVELPHAGFAAGVMQRFPTYVPIRPIVRAATAALLQLGLFGGAFPPIGPRRRDLLRLRRAMARAARLSIHLAAANGAIVHAVFVNVLETPADDRVVVVAGFEDATALVAATVIAPPTILESREP